MSESNNMETLVSVLPEYKVSIIGSRVVWGTMGLTPEGSGFCDTGRVM